MQRRPFIERDTGWGDFLNMLLLRRVYCTPARVAEQADAPASSTGVRQGRESSSLSLGTDDYIDHAVQQADDHQGERWLNPPHPVQEGEPE